MEGEIDKERWKMPDEDEEEEEDEFWGFEDLECECECDDPFSTSLHSDSILTRKS